MTILQCRYWTTIHEPEQDPLTKEWCIPHKDRGICIKLDCKDVDTHGWACDRRGHAIGQPPCREPLALGEGNPNEQYPT